MVNQHKFSFKPIFKLDNEKEVQLIYPKKACTIDSILPKILKISSEVSADTLHNFFNDMLKTGNLPDNLKLADITPVFKKKNSLHKVNLRPVSISIIYPLICVGIEKASVHNKLFCDSLKTGKWF